MKLYQTVDGTMIGFYQERGGAVQCTMYRDQYEQQLVTKYREEIELVPGHYERQEIWVPEYYVTRYYFREAHPARGLEAAWLPYEELIPAGYKMQRVWVGPETRTVQVPYQELEEVWVGGQPVYQYVDLAATENWEVGELIKAPEDEPGAEDIIEIIDLRTGEVLRTTARYLGVAERIDDNEFVVPQ